MISLLCLMGKHKWKHTRKNEYSNAKGARLGIQKIKAQRICQKCYQVQEQEVHCLGLKPPRYTKTWYNVTSGQSFFKAKTARKVAEDSNIELQKVLTQVKEAAKSGEINLFLSAWDDTHDDSSIEVRNLLAGLGYGTNKHGTGGTITKDLMVYW